MSDAYAGPTAPSCESQPIPATSPFLITMPLVRIDFIEGRSDAEIAAISDAVHRALVEVVGVPERDRFQVINAHPRGHLLYNPAYLNIPRTDDIIMVQVFFAVGRT